MWAICGKVLMDMWLSAGREHRSYHPFRYGNRPFAARPPSCLAEPGQQREPHIFAARLLVVSHGVQEPVEGQLVGRLDWEPEPLDRGPEGCGVGPVGDSQTDADRRLDRHPDRDALAVQEREIGRAHV